MSAVCGQDGREAQLRNLLLNGLYDRMRPEEIAALAAADVDRARREVRSLLLDVSARLGWGGRSSAARDGVVASLVADLLGLGPIDELIADPTVTEVMVNGTANIFYERAGRLFEYPGHYETEQQLRATIDRIISPIGRRVDEQHPLVSARLPQGHRVHAVIPPIALDGSVLTIRKFRERSFTLEDLVAEGSASAPLVELLRWAVRAKQNIAVSGGTGSGKTTLLNALAAAISPRERIVTIEDAAELRFDAHPHVVRLEARSSNQEGRGAVTIRDLVVNALRMRPDRIVVGEVRGEEALEMLQAMNTGHEGSLTTLHANSANEVPHRLLTMVGYSGLDLPPRQVDAQIASAIDVIVHVERHRDGVRRITEVAELELGPDSTCQVDPLARFEAGPVGTDGLVRGSWVIYSGGRITREAAARGVVIAEEVSRWERAVG